MLRAYMHGFFIDGGGQGRGDGGRGRHGAVDGAAAAGTAVRCPPGSPPTPLQPTPNPHPLHPPTTNTPPPARLYRKAKDLSAPFAYEAYRAQRVAAKMEEERKSRIGLVKKLPKVGVGDVCTWGGGVVQAPHRAPIRCMPASKRSAGPSRRPCASRALPPPRPRPAPPHRSTATWRRACWRSRPRLRPPPPATAPRPSARARRPRRPRCPTRLPMTASGRCSRRRTLPSTRPARSTSCCTPTLTRCARARAWVCRGGGADGGAAGAAAGAAGPGPGGALRCGAGGGVGGRRA
jgi:translation initiation factor IF-2